MMRTIQPVSLTLPRKPLLQANRFGNDSGGKDTARLNLGPIEEFALAVSGPGTPIGDLFTLQAKAAQQRAADLMKLDYPAIMSGTVLQTKVKGYENLTPAHILALAATVSNQLKGAGKQDLQDRKIPLTAFVNNRFFTAYQMEEVLPALFAKLHSYQLITASDKTSARFFHPLYRETFIYSKPGYFIPPAQNDSGHAISLSPAAIEYIQALGRWDPIAVFEQQKADAEQLEIDQIQEQQLAQERLRLLSEPLFSNDFPGQQNLRGYELLVLIAALSQQTSLLGRKHQVSQRQLPLENLYYPKGTSFFSHIEQITRGVAPRLADMYRNGLIDVKYEFDQKNLSAENYRNKYSNPDAYAPDYYNLNNLIISLTPVAVEYIRPSLVQYLGEAYRDVQ